MPGIRVSARAAGMTVKAFLVDGSFSAGDSLIGGNQPIKGLVLMIKQESILSGDTGGQATPYIDDIDVGDLKMRYDGDLEGLFDSRNKDNTGFFGFNSYMAMFNMAILNSSYDIRAYESGTFRRTFKVAILNA